MKRNSLEFISLENLEKPLAKMIMGTLFTFCTLKMSKILLSELTPFLGVRTIANFVRKDRWTDLSDSNILK